MDHITQRLSNRFPSFSRRWKQRKPNLSLGTGYSTPSRAASSRSSSLSSTAVPVLDRSDALVDPFEPSPIELVPDVRSAPMEIPVATKDEEPINREALASTPLLPPMIDEARPAETPMQSPLQSPTVAESTASFSLGSPAGTPQVQAVKTPPLSTKPSVASFRQHTRPGHVIPSSEIPPIMIADPNDPWAIKLGHANFTITPEPYLPEVFTAKSISTLFADWERARCNFTKHQVRTGEHYGITSKIYILTEEKWAEIDAQWKKNYDFTVAEASRQSSEVLPVTPDEPPALMKIPSLNDPKSEGKFPKLGDEDIVGPMFQFAAQVQPKPSRTANFLKMLNGLNIKIPSGASSRSRTAFQPER
ncbi:hypothetical protein NA57DRAFT_36335 [Rhizodiscina lignyota]|uniref:Uncharacterized protein n=1 Tax=Rhizodiscina lignyota TaxID=1504668 RepID=A0A9P4IGI6_9PEZI|nr:hypothetical protein NA57DRAFT_36335 [Rhizodiscina lignyota]